MTESLNTGSMLMEKNRLKSLTTDGIFAFAMTLRVTSMIQPRNATATLNSGPTPVSLLPDFYYHGIAFFVLAAFWIGHYEQFSGCHHIGNKFLYLNIVALFFVTLVPFSRFYRGVFF
jgi:uncharacterized membrane protein